MSIAPLDPATHTLTFLFTDLEGSTRLWQDHPTEMPAALERHDGIVRTAITRSSGHVVKTLGDGFMCVFGSTPDAFAACLSAQRALAETPWSGTGPLRVRMGLHAGLADVRDDDYFGPTVIRAARIMSAAHGGQVLASGTAAALALDRLPDGVALRDMGEHRLKDLQRPEHLFQVVAHGILSEFPPLATLDERPGNLPTPTTELVGREAEVREIAARLDDEKVRLVTLVGPGGTGKTRLALEVATAQVDRFPDGRFFVDLSTATTVPAVLSAIGRAVGLTERSDRELLDDVTDHLRVRRLLLVLDNFEQVTAAASLLADLLRDTAGLKVLVTSREALRIRGEHLVTVQPLSIPERDDSGRDVTASEAARYGAVELFVQRARAVRADFELTDDNAEAILEICRRLDGLPLAIELATARLNLFTPEALRDRLRATRADVLRFGARDLPERQQTIALTIDWSYRLLEPTEQRLLEALSAFGRPDVEGVEAVASMVPELGGADTISTVAALVDKSLVRRVDEPDGSLRLTMLETIREYSAARLGDRPELAHAVRLAHATHYAERARHRRADLVAADRERGLARMAADVADMQIAWHTVVDEHDLELVDAMADTLWQFYDARGWLHAIIELATDMLAVMDASPATPELESKRLALQLDHARILMAAKGYTAEVEEAYTTAVQALEEHGSVPRLSRALRGLATFQMYRADHVKAAETALEVIRLADQEDDPTIAVDGHLIAGATLGFIDGVDVGLEHLDRAIELGQDAPPRVGRFRFGTDPLVAAHTTSGFMLWFGGFPDRAAERSDRGVAIAARMGHPFTLAYALFHNGVLHLWRMEPEALRDRAVGVLSVAEEYGFTVWEALGNVLLGAATVLLGSGDDGLERIRRGQDLYRGRRNPPVFWPMLLSVEAVACLAAGHAADGLPVIDEAIEIFGGVESGFLPEFDLVRGDLLLATPIPDAHAAEQSYVQAFTVAQRFGGRMSELKAATRLARLWQGTGDAERARATLEAALAKMADGASTVDVVAAREALAALD